jgi:hypothetical protein
VAAKPKKKEEISITAAQEKLAAQAIAMFSKPNGELDVKRFMQATKANMTDDQFKSFACGVAEYFSPSGVIETWTATWDYGATGKLQVACATVGAVVVSAALLELAGRTLNVPQIQFISKLADWISQG